jgi:NAD(P)-dependent dehydrogenase (short-subunit alcohol dehydrogenase family)
MSVALVTGTSWGFGSGAAERLVRLGWTVIGTIRDPARTLAPVGCITQAIIARLRSTRSASTPNGSDKNTTGTNSKVPTRPARNGEPVNSSTSNGNATLLSWVPSIEAASPIHSRRKSRFLRRGITSGHFTLG